MIVILATAMARSEDCPKWGDNDAAVKFLQDNKPNSTAVDPACVNRAFATLSHDHSNTGALIGLLDFERSIEHDDFKTNGGKYPAIGALMTIGKSTVPFLIKAIKEDESALVRTNAADTLGAIYAPCGRGGTAQLEAELSRPAVTSEQQARLRAAKDYIEKFYASCGSEGSHVGWSALSPGVSEGRGIKVR
jgi:hypothetical protein